jgi:hypothetical protein
MESWRKAWKGNAPVEPLKDPEWVAWRREFLAGRTEPSNASDEVATQEHRAIQAQWMIDHVDVLEKGGAISEEKAAQIRRFRPLR